MLQSNWGVEVFLFLYYKKTRCKNWKCVCLSFLKGSIIKNQDLDCYGIFGEVGVCGDQSKVKNEQN